ncbi:SURF1 family protein [Hyphomicrobium nitrativorans]|uniref:SURF1 family protein n=1 Tax=Hyphomicrobium nitrativorans TaxID=1427356 RepID=UPI000AB392DC|nr:SURF1 family protein [Hyphomicrobium nitrativorans]
MAENKAGNGARIRGLVPAALATLVAFSIMVALGNWQMERLHWKEGLVAAIESGLKKEPVALEEPADAWKDLRKEEYRPVTVSGRFLHEHERHLFATDHGQMGWHIYTPLETGGGRILFVNRGFVPDVLKDPATRPDGQITGTVTVKGLVRAPGVQGSFEPDRDPAKNVWHWRDLAGMIASMGIEGAWTRMMPFFVDATAEPANPGGWPKGARPGSISPTGTWNMRSPGTGWPGRCSWCSALSSGRGSVAGEGTAPELDPGQGDL